jgi:hypothetical protein
VGGNLDLDLDRDFGGEVSVSVTDCIGKTFGKSKLTLEPVFLGNARRFKLLKILDLLHNFFMV